MPTPGGLVTKQELIDAQDDTRHLGEVSNGLDASGNPIDTSISRLGEEHYTVKGIYDTIKFNFENVQSVLPLLSPRYYGDGSTTEFQSRASAQYMDELFDVRIDGVSQRPGPEAGGGDFECIAGGIIKLHRPPWGDGLISPDPEDPTSAVIDILWYQPFISSTTSDFEQRLQVVETRSSQNETDVDALETLTTTQGDSITENENSILENENSITALIPDSVTDEATGTITRSKKITERIVTTSTAVTYTLDMSTFVAGDEFTVIPTVDAPDITLIVDEDLFEMPDGTTDTTVTLTTFATARFVKSGLNFKLRAN